MSDTVETSEPENKNENNEKKRVRRRKKLLYENIRKQMEFYFSDANISKDRFLGDLIKADPFVPLDTFLKFNMIRKMTQNVVDIVKALKHSTELDLSEDKLKVQRKTPVLPYDVDSRTVYVESIPVTANRSWLQRIFSDYGTVAYISLPKFKNTERIKGYAFIEYKKPESAQKCVSAFFKMGCKLPTSMPPEELSTIKMFSVEEPIEDPEADKKEESYEPPKKKSKKAKDKKKNMELRLDTEQESDAEKKLNTPVNDDAKSITTPAKESKTTDVESKDELTSQDESAKPTEKQKKKAKKLSKSRNKTNGILKNKDEAPKDALWGLQVLSKSEWKVLRNKFLNLQKKNMKELKKNLRLNYNFYNAGSGSSANRMPPKPHPEEENKQTSIERTPGVFVKTQLTEPCLDIRSTKRQFRTNVHVQHVDVKEGQSEVVLRFDTADAAIQYCSDTDTRGCVLTGAEEDRQWSLMENSRVAGKRPRGRTRLLARARALLDNGAPDIARTPASPQPTATHIRFDDE